MARRPLVIAFDVIETLFPLEPLRARILAAGAPGHVLELWFTRLLRDAFALTAAGGYRPFGEIAAGALESITSLSEDAVRGIVAGFAELDPHPDVAPALRRVREAGVSVITLTNGSAHTTRTLLRRAGVLDDVQQVLTVDDIQRWKPAPEIYQYAAHACQVEPGQVALVAAHGWDLHGAHQAGLVTGWVSRLEGRFPPVFAPPDVTGDGLVEVVEALLALTE
ncbi:haloacid dehalogenase type II [Amycolatopsis pithecellobii]|uniref:Haloacid dehalogenase type II n=1 Tax=Amycolatopsis pithecellobii TaxID=664692 RepID=A0A6N7YI51_9PSEU|nr:haloacid dehalogenase type II [Amycolatopsis pithecellobii]MTD52575.1 haloacid dehalogenase type II [Amycolatopsis pithecellobii]